MKNQILKDLYRKSVDPDNILEKKDIELPNIYDQKDKYDQRLRQFKNRMTRIKKVR